MDEVDPRTVRPETADDNDAMRDALVIARAANYVHAAWEQLDVDVLEAVCFAVFPEREAKYYSEPREVVEDIKTAWEQMVDALTFWQVVNMRLAWCERWDAPQFPYDSELYVDP